MPNSFFIWQAIVKAPSMSMDGYFLKKLLYRRRNTLAGGEETGSSVSQPRISVDNTPANSSLRADFINRHAFEIKTNIRLCENSSQKLTAGSF